MGLSMLGLERSTLDDFAAEIVQALLDVDRLDAALDAGRAEAQRLFAAGRAREQAAWDQIYRGAVTQSWLDGE